MDINDIANAFKSFITNIFVTSNTQIGSVLNKLSIKNASFLPLYRREIQYLLERKGFSTKNPHDEYFDRALTWGDEEEFGDWAFLVQEKSGRKVYYCYIDIFDETEDEGGILHGNVEISIRVNKRINNRFETNWEDVFPTLRSLPD